MPKSCTCHGSYGKKLYIKVVGVVKFVLEGYHWKNIMGKRYARKLS